MLTKLSTGCRSRMCYTCKLLQCILRTAHTPQLPTQLSAHPLTASIWLYHIRNAACTASVKKAGGTLPVTSAYAPGAPVMSSHVGEAAAAATAEAAGRTAWGGGNCAELFSAAPSSCNRLRVRGGGGRAGGGAWRVGCLGGGDRRLGGLGGGGRRGGGGEARFGGGGRGDGGRLRGGGGESRLGGGGGGFFGGGGGGLLGGGGGGLFGGGGDALGRRWKVLPKEAGLAWMTRQVPALDLRNILAACLLVFASMAAERRMGMKSDWAGCVACTTDCCIPVTLHAGQRSLGGSMQFTKALPMRCSTRTTAGMAVGWVTTRPGMRCCLGRWRQSWRASTVYRHA